MLQLMKRTSAHPTAIWIYDRLKEDIENLSIGTVYRNLKVLLDQNMIKRIESGRNYDCYDADTTLHYHFLCSGCDAIYDLDLEPYQ
jgi:Fur family transcriptional regulator, peroxide stress response regulator